MRRLDLTWAGNRRALVYVPKGGPPPGGYPLLCFLHGAGEAAVNRGVAQPVEKLFANGSPAFHANEMAEGRGDAEFIQELGKFVVVCPQLETRRRWTADDAGHVGTLVDGLTRDHGIRVDPTRRHLTGFSLGGEGVFIFDDADRERWASLWAVTPAAAPETEAPETDQSRKAPVTPLPRAEKRVLLHYGDPDEIVDPDAVRAFMKRWLPPGTDVDRAVKKLEPPDLKGPHYHSETAVLAYGDPKSYAWLG